MPQTWLPASAPVKYSKLVISSMFQSAHLHHDGRNDAAIQATGALLGNHFAEAVEDRGVLLRTALQLEARLDHVQRIHDKNLRGSRNAAGQELIVERQRLFHWRWCWRRLSGHYCDKNFEKCVGPVRSVQFEFLIFFVKSRCDRKQRVCSIY